MSIIDTLTDDTPHDVRLAIDLLEKRGFTVIPPKGSGDRVHEVIHSLITVFRSAGYQPTDPEVGRILGCFIQVHLEVVRDPSLLSLWQAEETVTRQ